MSEKVKSAENLIFSLIILFFIIYSSLFIFNSSIIIEGERYFVLFDDAMVSMKYAENFAQGNGLIWNKNCNKVEGITNLLWTLLMAGFHLLPIAKSKISLLVQIFGALFLLFNLFYIRKIAKLISDNSVIVYLSSVFLTAFYFPLNHWGLMGMEVSLLALLINIAVYKSLICFKEKTFSISFFIILGICTLIRLDMTALYLGILIFHTAADNNHRTSKIISGCVILFFFITIQSVFRLYYYHDILPNTYYLKISKIPFMLRIAKGMITIILLVWKMNWVLILIGAICIIFKKSKDILFLYFFIFIQVAYSIYTGGDAWDWWGGANRFVSIIMPLFFILFCFSLSKIIFFLKENNSFSKEFHTNHFIMAYILIIIFSLINFNSIQGLKSSKEWLMLKPTYFIEENENNLRVALTIKQITNREASVAVAWAGAIPYFSERKAIDLLGKNDKYIASLPMKEIAGITNFTPGHVKYDYSYSIGKLKPDVVAQLGRSPNQAKPFLNNYYSPKYLNGFLIYILKDSKNILWDKIN